MSQTETLVIDRSKWLRGTGDGELYRQSNGTMCCLGFFGVACGVGQSEMATFGRPDDVMPGPDGMRWPRWLVRSGSTTPAGEDLIRINDDTALTDDEREEALIRSFARHGVTVEFK